MNTIQVDSFEVQLGAGMLLQFRDAHGEPIAVLADAGIHASGYSDDHVLLKLPEALETFSPGNRRIDLIVGTHYDADHLCGLPPIIRDESIKIGEIWLPPVADDEAPNPKGASLRNNQYLPLKWLENEGTELAKNYLGAQWEQCENLRALEKEALEFAGETSSISWKEELEQRRTMLAEEVVRFEREMDFPSLRGLFEKQFEECRDLAGDKGCNCHADVGIDLDGFEDYFPEFARSDVQPWSLHWALPDDRKWLWKSHPARAARSSISFAQLRKAVAANAITASHLAEVIEAIKSRGGIPVKCHTIADGTPVRLKWSSRSRKFLPGATAEEHEPMITLLGPSESLVKKHRDKLPVLEAANWAVLSLIPLKNITPSNQLSYIFRVDHEGQGLLVTGDAGCVDYKKKPRDPYFPSLVKEFSSLHVIQVAHHGGHNAHFYRVLLEEDVVYPEEGVFLILSHATEDKHRPSEAFAQYIGSLPDGVRPSLLFTSRPTKERVEGFDDLIHHTVGRIGDVGDVRISFDGNGWQVDSHAIQV